MASSSKKRKVESENRIFQQSWVNEYFVIEQNNKPLCLICRNSLSVNKEYNIKRHYSTNHFTDCDKFLGEERITKAENLKKLLVKQQTYFIKSTSESENSVKASYIISQKIAKHSKSFSDGEFIKDCILAAVKLICPEHEKKFDNISLSRRTVTRRIDEMSNDIKQTLNEKIKDFQWYSLAVDESKDLTDSAQLCIFIRGIDKNFNITEELLSLTKLQTTTTGNDIFIVMKEAMKKSNLKYHNMSGISTDGAKSMVGKNIGAMAYFKNDMGESEYKDKLNFHCLIHQQNLCSKIVTINDVMTIVVKCINEIKSKSALRHREFLTFLNDMESAYGDLIYYCDVRWLSKGAMLKRFYELREEVKLFMEIKEKPVPELSNKEWLCDLSFLVDITTHLNDLNTKLQTENQIVTEMYGNICAFKNKLKLLQHQFNCNNFINFPTFQLNYKNSYEKQKYINILFALHQEFEERFMDFSSKECYFDVFSIPFLLTDVTKIPENFQLELIELQERKDLKMKFMELSKIEFYKNLDAHIFPQLINNAKKIISLFGSTYKCEQFFSKMTFLKSKYRSRITDENLESSLVVATTKIEPDISTLSTNKQWQVSH